MKRISKILTTGLAALTVLSSSTLFAGAATASPQVKVIYANSSNCQNIQTILNQYCGTQGCDINTLLKTIKGYCPDGNCSTDTPAAPEAPVKPEAPAKPEASQAEQPVVTPTAPSTNTESTEFNAAYEKEVIRLVNVQRANYGLSPLAQDDGAQKVARVRAKEIVQSFSHTRPNGTSCFTAASEMGVSYRSAGENIAYGYQTPEQVVNGWMNSEGHRKNILSASFSKIGVGCYKSGGVNYWSQFFIG